MELLTLVKELFTSSLFLIRQSVVNAHHDVPLAGLPSKSEYVLLTMTRPITCYETKLHAFKVLTVQSIILALSSLPLLSKEPTAIHCSTAVALVLPSQLGDWCN